LDKNKLPVLDKKGYAYKKYVKPILEREKELKQTKFKSWIKNNILSIIAIIVAIIALFK